MEKSKEAERKLLNQACSPDRISLARHGSTTRSDDGINSSYNGSERDFSPDTSADSLLLASAAWFDKRETHGHHGLWNVASACKRRVTQHRLSLSILLLLLIVAATSTLCSPSLSDTFDAVKNLDASTLVPGRSSQTEARNSTKTCNDPWARPGYIWYGKEDHDVRWVPYSYMNTPIADPDYAHNYNPEDSTYPNAPNELDGQVLARLPMEYSKAFQSQNTRKTDNRLEFMRNKHIMLLGSSLDQNFVRSFCATHEHEHPGKNPWVTPNEHINYCKFPDYNFTLSAVRHFGMHQSPWFSKEKYPKETLLFEERIEAAIGPLADRLGQPDLLVFTTGLWDFKYLHLLRQMHDPNSSAWVHEHLSPQRAAWMLSRITQAVASLRKRFPDTFLLYRTTTRLNAVRGTDDEEMVSIFQLNEGARAVMRSLGVPILNWADLVQGNHEYRDHMHFKDESRPNWLYSEMLLQHLQQLSDTEQDTSCWLESR